MPRVSERFNHLHGQVVYTEGQIDKREMRIADELMERFRNREVLLVGLLTGASYFLSDIVKLMSVLDPTANPDFDFMRVSNYAGGTRAAGPRILGDLSPKTEVAGRPVAVIDDFSDTGGSAELTKNHLEDLGASEVIVCTLLNRSVVVAPKSKPDIVGFEYQEPYWVVGRGLDGPGTGLGGGRGLPYIARCIEQPEDISTPQE